MPDMADTTDTADTADTADTPQADQRLPSEAVRLSSGASANVSASLSFDPVAHVYDDTRGYPPAVADAIAALLMRVGPLTPDASVLEIGIGTGRIALPLLAHGVNITGVDISERMVARLRAKYDERRAAEPERAWGSLRAELADMTALPFPSGGFAAVVAVHVLHLVPSWRQALDEAFRVVRPGGALLLGQDVSGANVVNHVAQDQWITLIRELGYNPTRIGASTYDDILTEAHARGLRVEEHAGPNWIGEQTPRQALAYIAGRTWSQTWGAPDDFFAVSIQRLNDWAQRHFKGALDTPQRGSYSFKVARISQPG
ncbi:MAG: class I SAM-dependent methyltransferase [Ktedonobacterales bacterium]